MSDSDSEHWSLGDFSALSDAESSDDEMDHQNPTEEFNDYWLYARVSSISEKYDYSNDESGKWMMFIKKEDIDETWKQAKLHYTQGDLLGITAMKVSTMLQLRQVTTPIILQSCFIVAHVQTRMS